MQNMSKSGHIDFLKLDIEGQEKYILEDKDSWPVLCTVRCMAAEVHDRLEAGATEALQTFLAVCVSRLYQAFPRFRVFDVTLDTFYADVYGDTHPFPPCRLTLPLLFLTLVDMI